MKALLFLVLTAHIAAADPPPAPTIIKAARLFDGKSDTVKTGIAILVEGDRIKAVGREADLATQAPAAQRIDLGDVTLMPGLIDLHTHLLLDDNNDYAAHIVKQSVARRAIQATTRAREVLMSGFTSLRDVDTEGAMFADADLAAAIAAGEAIGPRIFPSTRALAPTGGYLPNDIAWDIDLPAGAQLVDGPDALRAAVRDQVAHGARWIKVYADFKTYLTTNPARPMRSQPSFTFAELQAVVDEAHRKGVKVAAHAMGWDGIDAALRAGVDSIEHGNGITDDLVDRMIRQGVVWVPTCTPIAKWLELKNDRLVKSAQIHKAALKRGAQRGVRIGNGSDAGSYPWKSGLAGEIALLVDYGLTAPQALRAATSVAGSLLDPRCAPEEATCPRDQLGVIAPNAFADLIAVEGDPTRDVRTLSKVRWVMKAGAVVR